MGADDEDDDEDDEGGDDDEEEDDGGEDEDEDESEADEPEDPELRRKITEVLRANGIEAATGDSDEESEEEEMDDDQMMAIDDQLAQIFKESRKGKSKGGFPCIHSYVSHARLTFCLDENAQREATHFKNRILDLLDIFIKRQPTSPHVLRLIIPLVDLVLGSGSDEQQLSDKTGGLLRSRVGKLKDVPTAVDVNEVTPILEELHTRARKVHSSDALAIISQCSLYVSKVLLHNQADDNVVQVYRQSLVDFMTRKASDLNARFFDDIIKRHPNVAWGFRDDLLDLTNKTVNTYRLCQAFALLNTLVNRMSSLVSHHSLSRTVASDHLVPSGGPQSRVPALHDQTIATVAGRDIDGVSGKHAHSSSVERLAEASPSRHTADEAIHNNARRPGQSLEYDFMERRSHPSHHARPLQDLSGPAFHVQANSTISPSAIGRYYE